MATAQELQNNTNLNNIANYGVNTLGQAPNIPVSQVTPVQPLNLGNTTIDNSASLLGTTASSINYLNNLTMQSNDAQKNVDTSQTGITDLMTSLLGKTADTQAVNESSGLNAATKQLNDLNAQAQSLNREAQAIPIQVQQNALAGSTRGGNAPVNADMLRTNALKALSLAQQADVATANYTAAKDKAQQMIDLKYQPMEQALAIKKQQYEFNKDILASVDKKRTEALGIALKKQETDLAEKKQITKDNADLATDYAKIAYDAGQSDIASQITSLDSSSPTFKQDLAKLQAKITNPVAKLEIALKQAQLDKTRKEISLLGEPTPAEKKKEVVALKTQQGQTDALKEKVTLIDSILENGGLSNRVGSNILTRKPTSFFGGVGRIASVVGIPSLVKQQLVETTGEGQQFSGGVHKLASKEFLDALINAKSQGATFGALTDREGDALRASATQLNDWEIKDGKGMGTGVWNIDEESFKKELNNIRRLALKGIQNAQGTVFQQDEQSLLDNAFSPENTVLDPSNYYSN